MSDNKEATITDMQHSLQRSFPTVDYARIAAGSAAYPIPEHVQCSISYSSAFSTNKMPVQNVKN